MGIKSVFVFAAFVLVLLVPSALWADSFLTGNITAVEDETSSLGDWKYVLYATWDTGTDWGLSHLDLIVDDGLHCSCEALWEALVWGEAPGYLTGEEGDCQVGLENELNCMGDPSIGVLAPLLKFEPNEGPDCHAGPTGEMWITFYSDYPPGPIREPNLFLVDKYARYSEFGMVTGVFPALPCDPISVPSLPWGNVKAWYR